LIATLRHDAKWIVHEQDRSELGPGEASRISLGFRKSLGLRGPVEP